MIGTNININNHIYRNIVENEKLYRLIVVGLYVLATYIIVKIIEFVLAKIETKMQKMEYTSHAALLLTIKSPLKIFIWSTCLYKILVLNKINLNFIFDLRIVLICGLAIWLIFRFITQYIKIYIEQKERNKETIDYDGINFMKKLAQICSIIIITIFGLGKLGVSAQSLATISGVGSLVVGLAAKEMLANIFGGIMIYLDKPFSVGDWISSPDKNIEGDVEEIGWRRTRILTFAKHPIYVANAIFTDIIIENKTRMKSRRIDEIIPIRYVDIDKMDKIVKEIKEMLKNHSNINHRLTTIVCFDSVSQNATLNLKLYTFTNTIEWARHTEIKQDILIRTIKIIQENGGDLSYGVHEIILNRKKETPMVNIENSDIF